MPKLRNTYTAEAYALSKEIRTSRADIHAKMMLVVKKITDEKRNANTEELASMDAMRTSIEDHEIRLNAVEHVTVEVDESVIAEQRSNGPPNRSGGALETCKLQHYGESDAEHETRNRRATKEYTDEFRTFFLDGGHSLPHKAKNETRGLVADYDVKGGYLVMPETMSSQIIKFTDDLIWLTGKSTNSKLAGSSQSMGVPTLDTNPNDADYTYETQTITEDNNMTFGKRVMMCTPFRKLVLVTERFLRMSMNNLQFNTAYDNSGKPTGSAENIIVNRIASKFAVTKERAYHTGSGIGQPLGLYTASTRGISTARDKAASTTAVGVKYNNLVDIMLNQKVQYLPRCEWEISRLFMGKIMNMVDSNNRPILNFNTIPNQPTTLLQYPLNLSEFVPNTFTNGSYVGMFGDFSYYWTADSLDMQLAIAKELHIAKGQIGFYATAETDGMPVLEEAFTRLTWVA